MQEPDKQHQRNGEEVIYASILKCLSTSKKKQSDIYIITCTDTLFLCYMIWRLSCYSNIVVIVIITIKLRPGKW